jgi:hypothetical protein
MKSRIVKSLGCAWFLLSVAAGAIAGCGKVADEGELGGETHWLRTCSQASECGGRLECLCGVCTATCDDDATCGAITADARCVARGSTPFAGDCSAAAPARLCADAPSEPGPAPSAGGTGGGTSLTCGPGEVELAGVCLECDRARREVVDGLQARIDDDAWNLCETSADCVAQEWSTPCDGQCPIGVASTAVDAFEAAIDDFTSLACDPATWRPSCGGPRDVDCDISVFCVAGRCRVGGGLSCAQRASDGCSEDGLCATSRAFPYDAEAGCFASESVAVGCVDADASCPPVITPALDSEGRCFAFGNCLPAGFTPAPEGHPCRADVGATPCTE